ncbi:glycosyl hydrolase family 28-related protein [Noviherbaspirillum pedocola]|uniref:Rhamnogalacturonase A/B/Epimerase-like pectate lyase domain-containing protein n=1 Tax=Noviherbaspirillum pedocola TaxID=2801341 RepID=A0A934SWI5_9BURK|nr:glycosyl hydrolase family 28-related protein [Noviherbaspirillum pedocola]MBK4736713.1 hypothetical protein [Noviherbaspirillum pedocola]
MNERRRSLALLAALPALVPAGARAQGPAAAGVNVLAHGAVGDGRTDDTRSLQAAINGCPAGGVVYFPGGRTYLASNLALKPGVRLQGEGAAVLKAINSGDPGYFLATASYAANVPATADEGCELESLVVNAANLKAVALAWRAFYGRVSGCRIFGANDADLLIATPGAGGAAMPNGSMVNNRFIGNWFGGADDHRLRLPRHVVRLFDPSANKATDILFQQNYISGATQSVLEFDTAAGLLFQGNHVYGGPSVFRKGFMGFVCTGNYFENEVVIDDITSGVAAAVFGPGNTLLADLLAKFGSHGDQIVSTGNHYVDRAGLRHCYNDASKLLVSIGDIFARIDPVRFYNHDGRTVQPASSGRFLASNVYLAEARHFWNAGIGVAQRDASDGAGYTRRCVAPLQIRAPHRNGSISLRLALKPLGPSGMYEIEAMANADREPQGEATLRFLAKGTVSRSDGNRYQACLCKLVYRSEEWESAPALTAREREGRLIVELSGSFRGDGRADCFGTCYLKAEG